MKIHVIGDIHGNWNIFNNFSERIRIKYPNDELIFLSCGDFGYWPHIPDLSLSKLKLDENMKIYFCDGNHEDHHSLRKLENNEVIKNIFYKPRGSTLTLNNKNILFMGGADSVDKNIRTPGRDWFFEENISERDLYNLPKNYEVDCIISHTCPQEFEIEKIVNPYFCNWRDEKSKDKNRMILSYLLKLFNPELWFFGHWHVYCKSQFKNCVWTCLNKINDNNFFRQLY